MFIYAYIYFIFQWIGVDEMFPPFLVEGKLADC